MASFGMAPPEQESPTLAVSNIEWVTLNIVLPLFAVGIKIFVLWVNGKAEDWSKSTDLVILAILLTSIALNDIINTVKTLHKDVFWKLALYGLGVGLAILLCLYTMTLAHLNGVQPVGEKEVKAAQSVSQNLYHASAIATTILLVASTLTRFFIARLERKVS